MKVSERYLKQRGGRWHYVRRVPSRYADLDPRGMVRVALRTNSFEIARLRRDALAEADDEHWSLLASALPNSERPATQSLVNRRHYRAACQRAMGRGFVYTPAAELSNTALLEDLIERITRVHKMGSDKPSSEEQFEAEALLGGITPSTTTMSEAFELYCSTIAADDLIGKSPTQQRSWRKTKQRAITYFIECIGDKPMTEITRADALQFYAWWKGRLIPKAGEPPKKSNTANRDLGNLRLLFRKYFQHIGEEERPNPFRNLSFREKKTTEVPAFESDWVRSKILKPGALDGLNQQAQLIVYALIETGCRPSEIANLTKENIHLDVEVPYISIRPSQNREIKTTSSIRDIPLTGISLKAMQQAPDGFSHYNDRPDLLSASLMKAFRNRNLFPSEKHVIYSFRHSFEKRMQEADLDYGLRCLLMGHRTSRPSYGDGGSLKWRREQLLKIVHPYPALLLG